MPQSFSHILLHIIFSTKDHLPIITSEVEKELHAYLAGILKKLNCEPIIINSAHDHIHIFCHFPRTITVADLIEKSKANSSKWIKTKGGIYCKFQWQRGYGVFSVSGSKKETIYRYIQNQKEHHRFISFREEYLMFLKEFKIPYDEKYMWD